MTTNKDRINYLREKIKQLNNEISKKKREDEYLTMVTQIAKGQLKFKPVTEEEWEIFLPKEKEVRLLDYYHTLRTELKVMTDKLKEKKGIHKLKEWLESEWVRFSITGVELTILAVQIVEFAHTQGLFFQEEDEADSIV